MGSRSFPFTRLDPDRDRYAARVPGGGTRWEREVTSSGHWFQAAVEMQRHEQIDERSLALARAVVGKIDADPHHEGLLRARAVCARWMKNEPSAVCAEWMELLSQSWPAVRAILLDPSERGRRLRQSSPFRGILTPAERWAIYREASGHAA